MVEFYVLLFSSVENGPIETVSDLCETTESGAGAQRQGLTCIIYLLLSNIL